MVGFLNTYFELLQYIEIIYITNKCNQYVICLSFIPLVRLFMRNIQTAVFPHTHIENWTHVHMNLFTRNIPYYNLLKYLLFLLKHALYAIRAVFMNLTCKNVEDYFPLNHGGPNCVTVTIVTDFNHAKKISDV